MTVLEFIFSSPWVFLGTIILLETAIKGLICIARVLRGNSE